MLTLLVHLELRVCEVAKLELADIDWRGGEILIQVKRFRLDRLPLPIDVGEAKAEYPQYGRPKTKVSSLLLRLVAPQVALSGSGIAEIVNGRTDKSCPQASRKLTDHRISAARSSLTTRAAKWATKQVGGGKTTTGVAGKLACHWRGTEPGGGSLWQSAVRSR